MLRHACAWLWDIVTLGEWIGPILSGFCAHGVLMVALMGYTA